MKQFVFLYPTPEYINWEIENGAYGWKCPSWEKRWKTIFEGLSKDEKEKLKPMAIKEKQARFSQVYSRILNKSIDKRYRENGFDINWIIFNGHKISEFVNINDYDSIIECGIDFKTHTTKQDDGNYIYPDNDFLLNKVKPFSFLQIAGFHRWDCVDKLAKRAYERGENVLVDEDLTEMFYGRFNDKDFRVDKYPTYNPYKHDTKEDKHFFENFMKARKNRPWLWQNY